MAQKRKDWNGLISGFKASDLVFLDESGCNTDMTRRYAYSLGGSRAVDSAPLSKPKNTTILSSLQLDGTLRYTTFSGGTTVERFKRYLETDLLPHLNGNSVLIMDNMKSHHAKAVRNLLDSSGVRYIYLPPYSPDLNPIEKLWSTVKSFLRKFKARILDALPNAIQNAFHSVTISDCSGWFRFLYDLHVSGGFYAALLLLILALTGLTWSFGWYRDAFYTAFGISTTSKQTHAPTSAVPPKTAGERGSKKHPKTDYTQWAEVLADLQSRYPEYKSISIQDGSATVSTAAYGNTRGSDRYSFDPATGEITEVQLYKDLPKSGKIRGWIYSVHVGSWGGMTTRILTCLVSLLGTIFAITGYYFWIKKQFRKLR